MGDGAVSMPHDGGHFCIAFPRRAVAPFRNRKLAAALKYRLHAFIRRAQAMRWKISQSGHHDPRFNDLLAVLVLIVLIVAAWMYFRRDTHLPNNTAFIVPSQNVRW
jgi:hypothetical protein